MGFKTYFTPLHCAVNGSLLSVGGLPAYLRVSKKMFTYLDVLQKIKVIDLL